MKELISVIAQADLSGSQYKAVGVGGTVVATNPLAFGILENKPRSGEEAALVYSGRSKFKSGGSIVAGNSLTVTTSGFLVAISSGDGVVGKSLFTVASGGITEGIFNFANAIANV